MHIPLLRSRDINEADTAQFRRVVLISESMARCFWPRQDPIGRQLTLTFFPEAVREVAGVVGDLKQDGVDVVQPRPTIYMPLAQVSASSAGSWKSFPLSLVVPTISAPGSASEEVIRAAQESGSHRAGVRRCQDGESAANSLSQRRLSMELLASFAGLALVLATTGSIACSLTACDGA